MVGKTLEATIRLSAAAQINWTLLDGEHSGKGVNLLSLPFHRFLNVVQAWVISRLESQEEAEKWLAKLDSPIPGVTRAERRDDFDNIDQLKDL